MRCTECECRSGMGRLIRKVSLDRVNKFTRRTWGLGCVALCAPVLSLGTEVALSDEPSPELVKALSYTPLQEGVVFEKVAKDAIAQCSIDQVSRNDGKGFSVTGSAGQPLRWFADTNGDNKLDRWSYYNAGVEVYRESDTDFDETADEYRWLSREGLRWGVDSNQDGKIDRWKQISAEELTAEVVRAAATRDAERFSRLLISSDEIEQLGLGTEKVELLKQRTLDAKSQFASWAAGQNVVSRQGVWTNFGADKPGVVPAGTDGSTKDVIVYENAVALLEDSGDSRQLIVGTIVRVGDAWRIVDLPKAVSDGAVVDDAGVFFSASFSPRASGAARSDNMAGITKAMERLVTDLQAVDEDLLAGKGDPAVLQSRRADVLERLISASDSTEEETTWIRQLADTVSAAVQTGEYPGGVKRLNEFQRKLVAAGASEQNLSYVGFRILVADHNQKMQLPKADYEELQESHLTNLRKFVERYPDGDDAAEAITQIALAAEFTGDMDEAKQWYSKAAQRFPKSLEGQKAAGALRRLELEGKPFQLEATTIDGRAFNSRTYTGGPVIYHCWASWCEGCKAEMRVLKELSARYAKDKVRVVGINLDNESSQGLKFLKENSYPWVHLHDDGGLDSPLAVGYGILTLPANFIVDKDGKVVATGVHSSQIESVITGLLK